MNGIAPLEKHWNWRGGTTISHGYINLLRWEHPRANSKGYVPEHIVLAEKALGHRLPANAQVHHVNGVKRDNSNGNLAICESRAYHMLLHRRTAALKATGSVHALRCKYCKRWDAPEVMKTILTIDDRYGAYYPCSYHQSCNAEAARRGIARRKAAQPISFTAWMLLLYWVLG